MPIITQREPAEKDIKLLYETARIARRAKLKGNHPFGCLLADKEGNILLEGENTVVTEHNDCGHAETNLMIAASKKYGRDFLAGCSIYSTGEPCAMCTGAIYWANVRRIVIGFSERDLLAMTGADPENPTFNLPCREILARGQKDFEIVGPVKDAQLLAALLEDHRDFWRRV
ncbi:MAG: nucleoside deaminase [Treponema sp.]|jgi:tRNA(Arg) A34 adenosine deaminase TadA|nr:nucleoside deaminase [Treponema sp.]